MASGDAIAAELDVQKRVVQWITRRPCIAAFCGTLNRWKIRWAFAAGTAAYMLTAARPIRDVDIVIHPDDFWAVCMLSPPQTVIKVKPHKSIVCGDGVYLQFPRHSLAFELDGKSIDVVATGDATYDQHTYHLGMSDLAATHRRYVTYARERLYIAHPYDTMILKAVLQRGAEADKYDAADIAKLATLCHDQHLYTLWRSLEVGADRRVYEFLAASQPQLTLEL